jgi:hypothetical protein
VNPSAAYHHLPRLQWHEWFPFELQRDLHHGASATILGGGISPRPSLCFIVRFTMRGYWLWLALVSLGAFVEGPRGRETCSSQKKTYKRWCALANFLCASQQRISDSTPSQRKDKLTHELKIHIFLVASYSMRTYKHKLCRFRFNRWWYFCSRVYFFLKTFEWSVRKLKWLESFIWNHFVEEGFKQMRPKRMDASGEVWLKLLVAISSIN